MMSGLRIPKRSHKSQQSSRSRKKPVKKAKTPVSDLAFRIARSYLDERPPITMEKINEAMRPSLAADFANRRPEIEEGAMKLWNASKEKEDYESFDPDLNSPVVKDFKALWKVCLRLWELPPTVLISPMYGLKYSPARPKKGGRANQAVYSPEFSKLFAALITHPCWRLDHERFVLALQYLIKCRVDNRSSWPHKNAKERECPAIEALFNMFNESGYGNSSLQEMHKSAREGIVGGGVSVFSDFLYFIGQQVRKDVVEQDQTYYEIPGLPVTIGDMKTLTKAVTDFNWPDETWICSPEDTYNAFKAERTTGKNEYPTTGAQLKEYFGRSIKDIFRDIEIYRQGANPEISSPVHQARLGDVSVDAATDMAADVPADEEMCITQDGQHIRPEHRPVRPERRYKALVGGEESEDEQADLARNLRDDRVTRLLLDSQRRRRGPTYNFGDDSFPRIHGESPFDKGGFSSREVRPTTRQPATSGPSGFILSQFPIPSDIRLEKRVEVLERGQQRLESIVQDMRVSPSQEMKRLRQRVESHSHLRQLEESTRDTGAVLTGKADLVSKVHDLESQLAQATKDKQELSEKVVSGERENERLLRELSKAARDKQAISEKVESHELEIERLSRELAEKDKVHKRDINR